MIESIKLKFGSGNGRPCLEFIPTAVTVFIGPNNSGKSRLIDEISAQCINGQVVPSDVILQQIVFSAFSPEAAEAAVSSVEGPPPTGGAIFSGYTHIKQRGSLVQVNRNELVRGLIDPNDVGCRYQFAHCFMGPRTIVLNGRNRIELANEQDGGDLQNFAVTTFQHLFKDDELRSKFRDIVYKSFGSYAVLDPTKLGRLRIRLSPDVPPSPEIERGLGNESLTFHANAQLIDDASDGAKAFVGVLSQVMAGDPKVLLMDEPEAFLHPSLAYNMGREISRSLAATDKRLFVSTHSAQFLMGCIQSGVPLNIIRLTYRGGIPTARLLPSDEITRLMRNPLLRSTGVLSALFYESVVVTEADADRAFYQEINERLQGIGKGIPNCIFLNAQNKQTVPFILEPLRDLGIPSAAIYDVDFVKDGGGVATRFLRTAGVPALQQDSLNGLRRGVFDALERADARWKTDGGLEVLSGGEKEAANNYFDQLDEYGAFVVRAGELETWLRGVHSGGHGPTWLLPMFEAMGEDPEDSRYVRPTEGDVWAFVEKVAAWLLNPA